MEPLQSQTMVVVDPITKCFEIRDVTETKRFDIIANIVEQVWLTNNPWLQKVILTRGIEFVVKLTRWADAIWNKVHQKPGNIIRTFEVQDMEIDESNPLNGILTTIDLVVSAINHITIKSYLDSIYMAEMLT